nr:MAG TPA: hypothetical protein [Caudoviricetes sp.]
MNRLKKKRASTNQTKMLVRSLKTLLIEMQ